MEEVADAIFKGGSSPCETPEVAVGVRSRHGFSRKRVEIPPDWGWLLVEVAATIRAPGKRSPARNGGNAAVAAVALATEFTSLAGCSTAALPTTTRCSDASQSFGPSSAARLAP